MDFVVIGGGRHRYYRIKKRKKENRNGNVVADVSRIKCAEYDDPRKNKNIGRIMPKIGDNVIIIVKPYQEYSCVTGVVQDILTKKPIHTRGHKVRLKNGIIGRTLKILGKSSKNKNVKSRKKKSRG
jgi:uncharacterized repeat protein (TIGR03833 family)